MDFTGSPILLLTELCQAHHQSDLSQTVLTMQKEMMADAVVQCAILVAEDIDLFSTTTCLFLLH